MMVFGCSKTTTFQLDDDWLLGVTLSPVLSLLLRVHPVALSSLFYLGLVSLVETVSDQVVAEANQAESAADAPNDDG